MKKQWMALFMIGAVYGGPSSDLTLSCLSSSVPVGELSALLGATISPDSLGEGLRELDASESRKVAGYTVSQVLDLAQASCLAYKDKKGQDFDVNAYGFTKIYPLRSAPNAWLVGDNSAFIGVRHDGSLVLSFTGTTSLRNVATDGWCNWALDHENGGYYHNGVLVAVRSLQEQMMVVLKQIAEERHISLGEVIAQTEITGHSLGGGMALVAADILRCQGFEAQGVVTFAAPRVMDMPTARKYDNAMKSKTLVIKQFTDPVPVASPFVLGSKQVGHQVVLPFVLDTWQHLLSGYIEVLETLKWNNGEINVKRLTFGGLREKQVRWYFEADATKDQLVPTIVKGAFSLSLRALHRVSLDALEGAKIVYDHSSLLGDAAEWTLSKTIEAMRAAAKTAKGAAIGSHEAYTDTNRTTEEKIVDAVKSTVHFAAEAVKSMAETVKEAVQKAAPAVVSTCKWLGSKIWQRTKDFANDLSTLVS